MTSEPGSDHGMFSPGNNAGIDPAWADIDALAAEVRQGIEPVATESFDALDALTARAKQAARLRKILNRGVVILEVGNDYDRLLLRDLDRWADEAREALAGKETTT